MIDGRCFSRNVFHAIHLIGLIILIFLDHFHVNSHLMVMTIAGEEWLSSWIFLSVSVSRMLTFSAHGSVCCTNEICIITTPLPLMMG